MWIPEPDDGLPREYKLTGIRIGDVGIIAADSSFDFLFNVCAPANDSIHQPYGVPDKFEQVDQGEVKVLRDMHSKGARIFRGFSEAKNLSISMGTEDNP
jgi:hypothetical protein